MIFRNLKQEFWKSSQLNDAKEKTTSEKKDWKEMYQMLIIHNKYKITAISKLFVINIY